jgi:hypothetical protein
MPVRLLTDAERGRLSGFPTEVPTEDLHAFFTLTGRDRGAVPATSAPANRLGFALSPAPKLRSTYNTRDTIPLRWATPQSRTGLWRGLGS